MFIYILFTCQILSIKLKDGIYYAGMFILFDKTTNSILNKMFWMKNEKV